MKRMAYGKIYISWNCRQWYINSSKMNVKLRRSKLILKPVPHFDSSNVWKWDAGESKTFVEIGLNRILIFLKMKEFVTEWYINYTDVKELFINI